MYMTGVWFLSGLCLVSLVYTVDNSTHLSNTTTGFTSNQTSGTKWVTSTISNITVAKNGTHWIDSTTVNGTTYLTTQSDNKDDAITKCPSKFTPLMGIIVAIVIIILIGLVYLFCTQCR